MFMDPDFTLRIVTLHSRRSVETDILLAYTAWEHSCLWLAAAGVIHGRTFLANPSVEGVVFPEFIEHTDLGSCTQQVHLVAADSTLEYACIFGKFLLTCAAGVYGRGGRARIGLHVSCLQ